MPGLRLYVIDHRDHDFQPEGKIIRPWRLAPGGRYADFVTLQEVWDFGGDDHVGFFGYRKYLWEPAWFRPGRIDPAHAPFWCQTGKKEFDSYRQWLSEYDGSDIKSLLAQYDILQAAPFPVPENILPDFRRSRSVHDGNILSNVLREHGWSRLSLRVHQYHFITRWEVFDRMMRELEPLRQDLDPLITAEDSTNAAYRERPMAYVMERVYSLWLENSGLSVKEVPVLHCWEM